ncbi:MAG TPA: bifunctional phosphopantothenoylcysteine decarboxylase/phosphopantothenate--cysteine ligase CoaBC [Candidatus Cybelea sp.]|nr:bifunctional phosphopantothenoylcysteine decarboxylase/phosphopantothenate--cysteine ligase CoaBC [Candidatus Cybelea sp.]
MLAGKRILLIVSGGIAAYKTLELIRRGRERGLSLRVILTKGGAEFVTPLSLSALSESKVYQDLFSLTDESEMGHIRLSREADLVLVAPASADIMAKLAHGLADDLATATLLATSATVLLAPAMNVMMWQNPATQANVAALKARGIRMVGPDAGDLACGEVGSGRMAEPMDILKAIETLLGEGALKGLKALVTSGPTFEPIDPVRYIANRSSGKQGHAIAATLARMGAETTLVSGPTQLADPPGVMTRRIETAAEMLAACEQALPVDVGVFAAAVADWKVARPANHKLKKDDNQQPPSLELAVNPDILRAMSNAGTRRPKLVVGFAAETENLADFARAKLRSKGCDWILANDVSPDRGTFGGDRNTIHLVTGALSEQWPEMSKAEVADRLGQRIAAHFGRAHG